MKTVIFSLVISLAGYAAMADDGIDGVWKTPNGDKVLIKPCNAWHCMAIISGKYAGKDLGKLKLSNKVYKGTILDPMQSTDLYIEVSPAGKTLEIHMAPSDYSSIYSRIVKWTKE